MEGRRFRRNRRRERESYSLHAAALSARAEILYRPTPSFRRHMRRETVNKVRERARSSSPSRKQMCQIVFRLSSPPSNGAVERCLWSMNGSGLDEQVTPRFLSRSLGRFIGGLHPLISYVSSLRFFHHPHGREEFPRLLLGPESQPQGDLLVDDDLLRSRLPRDARANGGRGGQLRRLLPPFGRVALAPALRGVLSLRVSLGGRRQLSLPSIRPFRFSSQRRRLLVVAFGAFRRH